MSGHDRLEDDLLQAMTRTGEGFGGEDLGRLAAGGLDRGRRRWRRRSAAAAVGGAVALALVGGGAVYLTGGTDGSPAAVPLAAAAGGTAPSTASDGSGSGTGGGAATPSSATAAKGGISGDEVLATLQALLPKGRVTEAGGGATDDGAPRGAQLVFDDGKGQAAIRLSLGRVAEGDPDREEGTCPDRKYVPYDACTSTALPGGGTVTLFQGYEYPDRRADTKRWYAQLVGKDGGLVELSEWNAPKEKGAPVSRPTPPLTPEQLKAVVTDKSWDRIVAAVPVPVPVGQDPKEYGKDEILAITARLLPAGLKQTETGGQPGFANFVVDDGKGKSLVEINVQDWSKDTGVEPLFGGVEKRSDGARVIVRKQGGMWTVDTLHSDGLRVVISALNRGGQHTPVTRATPALSVEQLTVIALAPQWTRKK
ncbi:hypothetical protein [Kitasatospora sp. NBC_00458]|uniref:hypothetical protein n=1 Tax=Kitasatospora sp. NBC_00458 TaxID=2903568 RepID=UPI002E175828